MIEDPILLRPNARSTSMTETTQHNEFDDSQWRSLCAEWELSTSTQKQFCAERNINYALFVSWRSKILAERGETRTKKFTSLRIEPSVPLRSQSGLVMKLPNGISLHILPETSKQTLQITLDALGIARC